MYLEVWTLSLAAVIPGFFQLVVSMTTTVEVSAPEFLCAIHHVYVVEFEVNGARRFCSRNVFNAVSGCLWSSIGPV